jgi:hypothetical protein
MNHAPQSPISAVDFPPWPVFDAEQIDAVTAVLRSGKVNAWTGEQTARFECEFAARTGCRHAIALANGTVALELALYALGIGPGDEVVVPARSFVASASCCAVRGAVPVFADVDPNSQNLSADTLRAVLSARTKAVIAVHLAGWPCEMDPILQVAAERNLAVIEDCAQAQGATYRGRPVGSLGDAAAFSFCQDKIITTGGEGGMLTTNRDEIWERAWSYKDHGKSRVAVARPNPGGVFKWLHESIGTNWRMTEMQAAIGRVALQRLPEWLAARRRNAATMTRQLSRLAALRLTEPPGHVDHAWYKYYAFLRPQRLRPGWSRDRIVGAISTEGIPCGSGTCPEIYREKAFDGSPSCPSHPLPVARQLGETSLMFLVHPTLEERHVLETCRGVENVMAAASQNPSSSQSKAA